MKKLGDFLSILTITMVIISFSLVVIRYLFNIVPIKLQEAVIYLHSVIFMIGFLYCYLKDGHVRIDIFYQNKKQQVKNKIDKTGTLLFLLPFFGFIFYISFDYVINSIHKMEASGDAGGLPFVYVLKTLILIMPVLMILAGIKTLVRKK